jgi:hypothetical protein|tara:strand:+ start:130 stop:441 length:312 start_codon:yes stop_codon:yes gene_type:complete
MEQMALMVLQQLLLWAPCLLVLLVLAPRLQIAVLRQQLFLILQFPVVPLALLVQRVLTELTEQMVLQVLLDLRVLQVQTVLMERLRQLQLAQSLQELQDPMLL